MKRAKMCPEDAAAYCERWGTHGRRESSILLDESAPRLPSRLTRPLHIRLGNLTGLPPDVAALRRVIQPLGSLGPIRHFAIGISSTLHSTEPLAWVPEISAVSISSEAVRKYDEIAGVRNLRNLSIDQRKRKQPPTFLPGSMVDSLHMRVVSPDDLPCINACGIRLTRVLLTGRPAVDLAGLRDLHPISLEFRQSGIRSLSGVGLSRLERLHVCFCPFLSEMEDLQRCKELLLMACRNMRWDSIRSAPGLESLQILSHPIPLPGFSFIRGMPHLRSISVLRAPIPDLDITPIVEAIDLKYIFLLRASRAMLQSIAEARPDLRVVGGSGRWEGGKRVKEVPIVKY